MTIEEAYALAAGAWPDKPVCVRGGETQMKRIGFLWSGGVFQELGSGRTWEMAWGAAYAAYKAGKTPPRPTGMSDASEPHRRAPGTAGVA